MFVAIDKNDVCVAVKRVQLTPQNVDQMATEVGIMKECVHPNIVGFIDSYMVQVLRACVCVCV